MIEKQHSFVERTRAHCSPITVHRCRWSFRFAKTYHS